MSTKKPSGVLIMHRSFPPGESGTLVIEVFGVTPSPDQLRRAMLDWDNCAAVIDEMYPPDIVTMIADTECGHHHCLRLAEPQAGTLSDDALSAWYVVKVQARR